MAGISHKAILEQTDAPKERYDEIEKSARAAIEETVKFGARFPKDKFLDSLLDVKITTAQYQKIPPPPKLFDNYLSLYHSRARLYKSIILDSRRHRGNDNLDEMHLCSGYYNIVSYLNLCVGNLSNPDRENYESGRFSYLLLCRNTHKFEGNHYYRTDSNKLEDILENIF